MPKSQSAQAQNASAAAKQRSKSSSKQGGKSPQKDVKKPQNKSKSQSPSKDEKAKSKKFGKTDRSNSQKPTQSQTQSQGQSQGQQSKGKSKARAKQEIKEEAKARTSLLDQPDLSERQCLQPKKPLNGYMQYAIAIRPEMKTQNPDLSITELSKLMGQKWQALDENDRAPFMKLGADDKLRFEKDTTMLREKGYFITKDGKKSCDIPTKFKPTKTTLMPKKQMTAFMFFNKANHTKARGEEKRMENVMKVVSEMWHNCNAKDRKVYEQQSKKDHERYQGQLDELNDKGFFLLEDGTKSSDYEVVPRQKKGQSQGEEGSNKRQKK